MDKIVRYFRLTTSTSWIMFLSFFHPTSYPLSYSETGFPVGATPQSSQLYQASLQPVIQEWGLLLSASHFVTACAGWLDINDGARAIVVTTRATMAICNLKFISFLLQGVLYRDL